MDEQQPPPPAPPAPPSPRQRMLTLQAIPERQRTDAEWDELNELEILLAPGNRERGPEPQQQQHNMRRNPNQQQPGGHQKPNGGGQQQRSNKPGKKFHKRPGKRSGPV